MERELYPEVVYTLNHRFGSRGYHYNWRWANNPPTVDDVVAVSAPGWQDVLTCAVAGTLIGRTLGEVHEPDAEDHEDLRKLLWLQRRGHEGHEALAALEALMQVDLSRPTR